MITINQRKKEIDEGRRGLEEQWPSLLPRD